MAIRSIRAMVYLFSGITLVTGCGDDKKTAGPSLANTLGLTINAPHVALEPGQTFQFSAHVQNVSHPVSWSIQVCPDEVSFQELMTTCRPAQEGESVGFVRGGRYTAPLNTGTFAVSATSTQNPDAKSTAFVRVSNPGTVTVQVKDNNLNPVQATLTLRYHSQIMSKRSTSSEGSLQVSLPSGSNYQLSVEHPDFYTAEYFNIESYLDENIQIPSIHLIPRTTQKNVVLKGTLSDASFRRGDGIPFADIFIRKGLNARENSNSPVLKSAVTNREGHYIFENIEPGYYTLESRARSEGENIYVPSYHSVYVSAESEVIFNPFLTKKLKEGQLRAVLTWGKSPSDLDAQISGPGADNSEFHLVLGKRSYPEGCRDEECHVTLSPNIVSGYGPEIITLLKTKSGIYRYVVENTRPEQGTLQQANPTVYLFDSNGHRESFGITPTGTGEFWHVFDFENGKLKMRNEVRSSFRE